MTSVELHEPSFTEGNVTLLELAVIAAIIRCAQPQALFEIGTFDGRTTLNMALNAPDSAIVHTLDLPKAELDSTRFGLASSEEKFIDKARSGLRFADTSAARKISQLYGDSGRFDFSAYKGRIDLVFVDGSHAYDYVMSDTERALELLRDGRGRVLWHDYDPAAEGVFSAINELHARGGVYAGMTHISGTALVYLELV